MAVRFLIEYRTRRQDIVNRRAFQSGSASDLKGPVLVLEVLLPVSLGDVQRDRLRRPKPLITDVTIRSTERLGDTVRRSRVLDRQPVNIQPLVVEDSLGHDAPFEYEYRSAEYEYE